MLPQRAGHELENEHRVLDAFKQQAKRCAPAQHDDDIIDELEMCRILGFSKMTAYRYRRDGVPMPAALPYCIKVLPNGEKRRQRLLYSRQTVLAFKNSGITHKQPEHNEGDNKNSEVTS